MTNYANTIRSEIAELRAAGVTEILVSVDENGDPRWGEATALPAEEMAEAMVAADMSTEGMLTAAQFESRF